MTPLPKRGFGPPLVRYVFHPPQVSVLFFSCTKVHDRADQKLFSRGPKIFGRERSLVRFPPPIRFAPPHITAQKVREWPLTSYPQNVLSRLMHSQASRRGQQRASGFFHKTPCHIVENVRDDAEHPLDSVRPPKNQDSDSTLAHRIAAVFAICGCAPSRTPEIAAISETRDRGPVPTPLHTGAPGQWQLASLFG